MRQIAISMEYTRLARGLFPWLLAASGLSACTEPGSPEPVEITASAGSDGGGPLTTGVADDGGGTAGTGGPSEIAFGCLINEDPNFYGLKYQCRGALGIHVVGSGLGQTFDETTQVTFGNGNADDPYEAPKVMACCSELPPNHLECEQQHYKACVIDMIETGCRSLGPNIASAAPSDPAGAEPYNKAAEWINREENQTACIETFLVDTGIYNSTVECDVNNEPVFDWQAALVTAAWSFNPPGLFGDMTIEVQGAEILALFPDPEFHVGVQPDQCGSADDNDNSGGFFTKTDSVGPYDLRTLATSERADLVGPPLEGEPITGDGDLASVNGQCELCSQAAFDWDTMASTGKIQWMALHSASATTVGTSKTSEVVDRFRIELYDDASAPFSGNSFTIPRGEAQFLISGESMTDGGAVLATNHTAITVTRNVYWGSVASWTTSAFTLRFEDGNKELWDIAVTPSTWK